MRTYEGVFIFPPDSGPDAAGEETKVLENLIQKHKGSVKQKIDWGKKPLGYELRKNREGHFLIWDFEVPAEEMEDFRKGLELEEKLLKFMITVKNTKAVKKPAPAKPAAKKEAVPAKA